MVTKEYDWSSSSGADLGEHSQRKHKVLREYFRRYIAERCKAPNSRHLKLVIVDAFSGGGIYSEGELGSPLVFLQTLLDTISELNTTRSLKGWPLVQVRCLAVFNDICADAVVSLKKVLAPIQVVTRDPNSHLDLDVRYFNKPFDELLPELGPVLSEYRCQNVMYNLDPCGHSLVSPDVVTYLMRTADSVEVFLNYGIQSFLTYLSQADRVLLESQVRTLGVSAEDLPSEEGLISKNEFLGVMETLAYNVFKRCAPFVSPFSINNPDGWRYWYLHFANRDRARQVYNDVLHDNSSQLGHFGRAGLRMLSYDPRHELGVLSLFDEDARSLSREQLPDDIANLISESGDNMQVSDFYRAAYSQTPAHSDDIHSAIFDSGDLKVLTAKGKERRRAHTISRDDTIQLNVQRMFPVRWPTQLKPKKK